MHRATLVLILAMLGFTAFPVEAELVQPAQPNAEQLFAALNSKAEAGDTKAQYELGMAYTEGAYKQKKNDNKAVEWITRAAEGGNLQAQFKLAEFYRTGYGLKADSALAITWYQKAADQGSIEASPFMCTAYMQDKIAKPDIKKAFNYCKTAAEKGNANAQYALGMAYEYGRGTTADNSLALKNLTLAAGQGQGSALNELGQIYQIGDLVSQDYNEAFSRFKKGAQSGNRSAIRFLAQSYEQGAGVAANVNYAARLYEILARDDKDKAAQDWLKTHTDMAKKSEILTLDQMPRDVIFYATETDDPRFQTMDIHGYFDLLSASSYPANAQNDGIGGSAQAECRFNADGNFDDCVLINETPEDYGFGAALMRVMERLGSSGNKTDWAKRFDGKSLRISLKWKP